MNNEQMQSHDEQPNNQTVLFVVLILFLIVIAVVGYYLYKQSNAVNNSQIITPTSTVTVTATSGVSSTSTSSTTSSVGQIFSNDLFSYNCPDQWTLATNKNYDGKVTLSECTKVYSGTMSFDDGVDVTFGYVPQDVADSIDSATGQKYADTILNQVKNETNAQTYTNNNFTGYMSGQTNAHTLALIARYPVSGGYYEVSAMAMGNTKTSQEYQQIINDIVTSFKVK